MPIDAPHRLSPSGPFLNGADPPDERCYRAVGVAVGENAVFTFPDAVPPPAPLADLYAAYVVHGQEEGHRQASGSLLVASWASGSPKLVMLSGAFGGTIEDPEPATGFEGGVVSDGTGTVVTLIDGAGYVGEGIAMLICYRLTSEPFDVVPEEPEEPNGD